MMNTVLAMAGKVGRQIKALFEAHGALISFGASGAFLAFAWGVATAEFGLFPYRLVRNSALEVRDFTQYWENDLGISPTRYVVDSRNRREAIALNPDKVMPGYRVVAGYFHDRAAVNGAVLLNEKGEELFFWPIDPSLIEEHLGRYTFLHGFDVLKDGSVVVNFDNGYVLTRFDPCGDVVWTSEGNYHHAVNLHPDGSLWSLGSPEFPHAATKIDPETGAVLKSVPIMENLVETASKGVWHIMTTANEFNPTWLPDPFHSNDVEVLTPDIADAFPMFEAGDMMISLRSPNLVAVVDGEGETVKWWQHGPWHRQHDPDFMPNGKISVFDNNMNGEASRIIEIDPLTRETKVAFEGSEETPFYTWIRGKHQRLPNGNILITEPQAGRVFEVTAGGEVVWEYHNRYDEAQNLLINKSIWLPSDFFTVETVRCEADG
ncbi:MAG: arylsulfotransferase family protein [Pseudomonadota bacterium]